MKVNFENDNYLNHLNMLKNKSMFPMDYELTSDSNILLLQTCSTHKDYLQYKKKYLVLAFKEIIIFNKKCHIYFDMAFLYFTINIFSFKRVFLVYFISK